MNGCGRSRSNGYGGGGGEGGGRGEGGAGGRGGRIGWPPVRPSSRLFDSTDSVNPGLSDVGGKCQSMYSSPSSSMIVPTLTDSGSRVWMGGPLRSSSCQSTGHHPMGRSASATLPSNPLLHSTLQVSVVLLQESSAKLTTERMRVQVTILQRRISLIRRCFQLSHQGERSTFNVQCSIISGSLGANERGYRSILKRLSVKVKERALVLSSTGKYEKKGEPENENQLESGKHHVGS